MSLIVQRVEQPARLYVAIVLEAGRSIATIAMDMVTTNVLVAAAADISGKPAGNQGR